MELGRGKRYTLCVFVRGGGGSLDHSNDIYNEGSCFVNNKCLANS